MLPRKSVSIPHAAKFDSTLRIKTRNNKHDLLVGFMSGDDNSGAIYLAKMAEPGILNRDVWLDTDSAHVVYIIGSRRGGKSYTLGAIAESMVSKEFRMGEPENAVLIFDTLNIFWTMQQPVASGPQSEELKKWGFETKSIQNSMVYYPRGHKKEWMDEYNFQEFSISTSDINADDITDLFELNPITDPQGQLISEVFDKTAERGYDTRSGEHVNPIRNFAISDLIDCLDNDIEGERFPENTREAVRRRLASLEREEIFSADGTPIKDLFIKGNIADILLMDLEPQVRGLIVGVLVRKLFRFRGETVQNEKKLELKLQNSNTESKEIDELKEKIKLGTPRGWILIDEGHNYMPASKQIGSLNALKQYVNEGRNLGLSLATTTQNPAGINSSVQRNADILIVHKIGTDTDIKAAEGMLRNTVPEKIEFTKGEKFEKNIFAKVVRQLQLGYAIISADGVNRIMYVRIRPRISVHGGLNY